jgi:cytochrome c oxidase accessory protein FixG
MRDAIPSTARCDSADVTPRGRPPVRRPDLDTVFSVNADGSRNPIQPADVRGRFQRRKHVLWFVLIAVYLAVPWLELGGQPVLRIDLPARHFFLAGRVFDAQDFWLAFFFVSGLGFALFVVAALFGRMWCGYACPQTVFLEGVFRRIERWIEGAAPARSRLDRSPWNATKLARRGTKLVVFLGLAAVVAHSLLGYFMPVTEVVAAMTSSPARHPTAFTFAFVTTGLLFVNFTWFREQTCIALCPYGRLQGALYDQDTVVVGYDRARGEPRGAVGVAGAGACVDCNRCVAVCPTGIDIRHGTQMECVGCANCIDACDAVMTKLGRAPGLVRYDSQRGFDHGQRRFVRPRLFVYAALLVCGVVAFALATTVRVAFESALVRRAGSAFTLSEGRVGNVFDLQITNKLDGTHEFRIEVAGPAGVDAEVALERSAVRLDRLGVAKVPVRVHVPAEKFRRGLELELVVRAVDSDVAAQSASIRLLGPSGAH